MREGAIDPPAAIGVDMYRPPSLGTVISMPGELTHKWYKECHSALVGSRAGLIDGGRWDMGSPGHHGGFVGVILRSAAISYFLFGILP